MKRFDIITIFPEMINAYAGASILGKAQEKKLIDITAHNLRDYAPGKHKQVDDTPYGGGPGMVMMIEPFDKAVRKIRKKKNSLVIATAANGKPFTQREAVRLAEYDQLIFLCGRYEGIDQRVIDVIADESFSVGPYVMTGGELPALTMTDAVARNIPDVLGNADTLAEESHTTEGQLEYPQYTKPPVYKYKTGMLKHAELAVPDVLMSGNHAAIDKWRKEQSEG
jgi:tRNA (guanine37-N1)-methyltransferase